MNQNIPSIGVEPLPTPDELYRAAVMIEDAATVAGILACASIGEKEMSSVMNFFSDALMAASKTLTTGLDTTGGTFSKRRERRDPTAA